MHYTTPTQRSLLCLLMAVPVLVPLLGLALGADSPREDSSAVQIDSRSLDGWVNVNGTPTTWRVEDGALVCTGVPHGMLRTARPLENFVLELEWKHEKPNGNAGIFIWSDAIAARGVPFPRSIEVQVMLTDDVKDGEGRLLYTGQGDIFSIHGARCTPLTPHPAGWQRALPSARHTKGAGEWNQYRIEARDGVIKLAVNGHEVSEVRDCEPRAGYLCLESEGSEIRFRNIKITELPSRTSGAAAPAAPATDEAAAATASAATAGGWQTLFGADLSAWRLDEQNAKHWIADGTLLRFDGKGSDIWSKQSFEDFDLIADWRWTSEHQGRAQRPVVLPDGSEAKNPDGSPQLVEVDERDSGIFLRGSTKAQVNMWMWPIGSGEVYGYRTDPKMSPEVRAACTPKVAADAPVGQWNRIEISMRGDKLTVRLNGKLVLDGATLPGVPARGPIGLQSHGCSIEFMNIYVRPVAR